MRILVAEDDYVSRKVIEAILRPYGDCDLACDGEKALSLFKKAFSSDKPYNLLCLDIMMPEKDGQAVLKEIREMEHANNITGEKSTKIIMTSALGDYETIKTAFQEECDAYLVKPIGKEKLLNIIKQLGLGNQS